MNKVIAKTRDGLKHPIIYTAINGGLCHIIQSYFYKHVLKLEISGLVAVIPGLIFGLYASLSLADDLPKLRKNVNPKLLKYLKPLYWNLAIIIATFLSIAIPYFNR